MKHIVYGNVPSKSNCYKIIKLGGRCSLAKNKDLKLYESAFGLQLPELKTIESAFGIIVEVYYDSRRPDLDNSLKIILDCLQQFGAIKNDNKCVEIAARKYLDKKNPRIEFELYETEEL